MNYKINLPNFYNSTFFSDCACEFEEWCKNNCSDSFRFENSLTVYFKNENDLQRFKKKFIGEN